MLSIYLNNYLPCVSVMIINIKRPANHIYYHVVKTSRILQKYGDRRNN